MTWRKGAQLWLTGTFGLLAVIYVLWNLYAFLPYCSDHAVISDDLRQHLLPFYAELYPENFTDRFLVDYARGYLPVGYYSLFRVFASLIDPLTFSKFLGIFLLLPISVLSFLIGKRLGGIFCGFATLMLTVHCEFILESTACGLFRSFGYPLFLGFLYCWILRRLAPACILLLVQALFYPPVFLVSWTSFIFEFARHPFYSLTRQKKLLLLLFITSAIAFLTLKVLTAKPPEYGKVVSLEQAKAMPEWHRRDGRFKELPLTPARPAVYNAFQMGLQSNRYGLRLAPKLIEKNANNNAPFFGWYIILLLPPFLLCKPKPYWFFALLVSSVGLYSMARIHAFSLGWPDRYLWYCLPALTILLLPLSWNGIKRFKPLGRRLGQGVILILLACVFVIYPAGFAGAKGKVIDTQDFQPMLNHIKNMNGHVLLAGWPTDILDNVPIYTYKEVLVDYEHAHPLYLGYYAMVCERISDDLRLIFATDRDTVRNVREKYGLTHLILEKRVLAQEGRTPGIFAPFNDMASSMRKRVPRESFVFYQPPDSWVVYEDQYFQIVDLGEVESRE